MRLLLPLLLILSLFAQLSLVSPHNALVPKVYTNTGGTDPYPIGVSSLGMTQYGTAISVKTNEVLGYALIKSIQTSGASLQLNVVVVAKTSSGEQEYWVQNAIQFSNNQMRFIDNVWNFTSIYANMSPELVSGFGSVQEANLNGKIVTFYEYATPFSTFSLPMCYILLVDVTYSGATITIYIGYMVYGGTTIYDEVSIAVTNLQQAYIYVGPGKTGNNEYFDAELVWGGEYGGQEGYFDSLTSLLAIYYQVEPGIYSPFPTVYNYGFDTGETAGNLQANIGNDGMVCVTVGTPNPQFLTDYFTPWIPGWTMVTVLSNYTYYVNGYNFTANNNFNVDQSNYGLPYYVSFITQKAINLTLPTFIYSTYRYVPQEEISVENETFKGQLPLQTKTYFNLSNGYYFIIVNYVKIPNLVRLIINVPIWGLVNGKPQLITSGNYPYGTVIQLEVNYTYLSSTERIAYIPNVTYIILTQNITIHVTVVSQFLINVNSTYPLHAFIDGKNVSFTTGWYNKSSVIIVPLQYYYVNEFEREMLLNPITIEVSDPTNYTAKWITQFYVLISSEYKLLGNVNGQNETLTSNWFNESTVILIPEQYDYLSNVVREALINPIKITVNSPVNYTAIWGIQYFVTSNTFPAYINGSIGNFTTGWYFNGTVVSIPNKYYYISKFERVEYLNSTPIKIVITSPLTVTVLAVYQYYVNISTPLQGYVNGTQMNITSGWYNKGTSLKLEAVYYKYITQFDRWALAPNVSQVIVNSPIFINVSSYKQFYIVINSTEPIYAIIDGEKVNLTTGWFDEGTIINIPIQYVYLSSEERLMLINNITFKVTSPFNYTPVWKVQYYVTFISNKPIDAIINGALVENISSGWYFNGSKLIILTNITYPIDNYSRLGLFSVTPSNTLVLTSPLTVKVVYEIQYKVIINGNTSWVFNGSEIRLYSYEPFYYQVSWQGTYNVPNGYVITVNKPIVERAIISINYINVVSALLFVLSPLLMLLAVIRRK